MFKQQETKMLDDNDMDQGSGRGWNYKLQVHCTIQEEDRDRLNLDFKQVCLLKFKSNAQRIRENV